MGKIIQLWQQTPDGKDVSFTQSYGASGDQARAVIAGLKADIVFLALGADMNALVDGGVVDSNWDKQGYNGHRGRLGRRLRASETATRSTSRRGTTWSSPASRSSRRIPSRRVGDAGTCSPRTRRTARRQERTSRRSAFVQELFKHVVSQDSSAPQRDQHVPRRQGRRAPHLRERGDRGAAGGPEASHYLVPQADDADRAPDRADQDERRTSTWRVKFIAFTKTAPAQDLLAQAGFRLVLKSVAKKYRSKFPTRSLIRIEQPALRRLARCDKRWFDPKSGLMVGIEKAVGGPTG